MKLTHITDIIGKVSVRGAAWQLQQSRTGHHKSKVLDSNSVILVNRSEWALGEQLTLTKSWREHNINQYQFIDP